MTLSTCVRAQLALLALGLGACEPATDIAGHIRTDADAGGVAQAIPELGQEVPQADSTAPATPPPSATSEPARQEPARFRNEQRWGDRDAGARRQGGSFFEEGMADSRDGEGTGRRPSRPFGDEDLLWVRGWQLADWTGETHPWPLEPGLEDFFQEPPGGQQAAVWVSGEDATKISDWWESIPQEDPAIRQLEGQRFVVAQDSAALIFAVTAERPSDGTFSLLPLPKEGLDRD